jgi:hypothetical protein
MQLYLMRSGRDVEVQVLLLISAALVLSGCNGARVVENQYKAPAGAYVVSSDMTYVGEVPMTYLERCTGNGCTVLSSTTARIVEDIFVRAEESKVKEFVLIGFKRISGRYYWPPFKLDKVAFAGGEYVEFLETVKADEAGDVYLSFLTDAGYKADAEKYYMRYMMKNVSEKTRAYVVYVCSENMLPEKDRDDLDVVKKFLQESMEKRVSEAGI